MLRAANGQQRLRRRPSTARPIKVGVSRFPRNLWYHPFSSSSSRQSRFLKTRRQRWEHKAPPSSTTPGSERTKERRGVINSNRPTATNKAHFRVNRNLVDPCFVRKKVEWQFTQKWPQYHPKKPHKLLFLIIFGRFLAYF